jgi:hypothetical protein
VNARETMLELATWTGVSCKSTRIASGICRTLSEQVQRRVRPLASGGKANQETVSDSARTWKTLQRTKGNEERDPCQVERARVGVVQRKNGECVTLEIDGIDNGRRPELGPGEGRRFEGASRLKALRILHGDWLIFSGCCAT